jgi:hypothetical protein
MFIKCKTIIHLILKRGGSMKKYLLVIIFILILSSLFSVSVSAATKQDVIEAAEAAVPEDYSFLYLIQFENILNQLDVSDKNCDRIIEIINELKQSLKDSGHTLHLYTEENLNVILKYFDEVCNICGLTYEYKPAVKDTIWHAGDVVCLIYNSEGILLGEFDGDQAQFVNKTDTAVTPVISFVLPVSAVVILAAAVFVFIKTRKTVIA